MEVVQGEEEEEERGGGRGDPDGCRLDPVRSEVMGNSGPIGR